MTEKDRHDPQPSKNSREIKVRNETYDKVCDDCRSMVHLKRDYDQPKKRVYVGTCTVCEHEMRVDKPL